MKRSIPFVLALVSGIFLGCLRRFNELDDRNRWCSHEFDNS